MIFVKNSVIFESVCFNNNSITTQHTPKHVKRNFRCLNINNCLPNYCQFFFNLNYNSEKQYLVLSNTDKFFC